MSSDLHESRRANPSSFLMPERDDTRLRNAESLLLQALEQLHGPKLTVSQRESMALALSDQIAATSRLRRFPLGNDDAPFFIPTRVHRDA